jgi:fructose-1,6-bisphosphatase/inositol monophosphatase family enzyme
LTHAQPPAVSGATPIDVALRAAREGGAIALRHFRAGEHEIGIKGRGNIVTDADLAVERHVAALLRAEYPSFGLLSEETSNATDPERGWVWVLDPIDGTKNFSQRIPFWCVNVALCHDGEPVAAVTYDAAHDEAFWAVAGGGARVNDTIVTPSSTADVQASTIGLDIGYDEDAGARQLALMRRIFPNVQTLRVLGSAALGFAYAAAARLDLFTHGTVAPWDIAAGMLLIREAGGAASNRAGGPLRITSVEFVAGGRRAHDDFMARYAREASAGRK